MKFDYSTMLELLKINIIYNKLSSHFFFRLIWTPIKTIFFYDEYIS